MRIFLGRGEKFSKHSRRKVCIPWNSKFILHFSLCFSPLQTLLYRCQLCTVPSSVSLSCCLECGLWNVFGALSLGLPTQASSKKMQSAQENADRRIHTHTHMPIIVHTAACMHSIVDTIGGRQGGVMHPFFPICFVVLIVANFVNFVLFCFFPLHFSRLFSFWPFNFNWNIFLNQLFHTKEFMEFWLFLKCTTRCFFESASFQRHRLLQP